jgi:phospho-N-acetylmuramoyl-pentapeptide-transferase
MLTWIAEGFSQNWGPLRLFNSFFVLNLMGFFTSAAVCWIALPKLWRFLPTDQGRAHAVNSEHSVGKPMSAGIIFVPIFVLMALLFAPYDGGTWKILPLILSGMLVGFIDDRSGGLSEYVLAALDLILSVAMAVAIFGFEPCTFWLPFTSEPLTLPAVIHLPISVGVLWISINATNCTDGVDGLSSSLTGISFVLLAIVLYVVIGNETVSSYLLIPHDPETNSWSVLGFVMAGCLAGYLWYNAPPSLVLMGDSGSRPIGLLMGTLVVATKNPFLIFVIGTVILGNGATGLVKVALLRFFKIGLLHNIRFPLHDHFRKNLGWSDSQVIIRFILLHISISAIFLAMILKVR